MGKPKNLTMCKRIVNMRKKYHRDKKRRLLNISLRRNAGGERRKECDQSWSDGARWKPVTASFRWGRQPPSCLCARVQVWGIQLERVHAHSTSGYQYDGRTSGAQNFRSLLHKQGCLRTKEWLEFVSRLVQKSCICTFRKDGGEMNLTINTAFCDD